MTALLPTSTPLSRVARCSRSLPPGGAPAGPHVTLANAGTPSRLHPAGGALVRCPPLRAGLDDARRRGYTTFVAITMGNNARMMEVLRNSGFPCTTHYASGEVEVHLDITRPPPAT
jgi:hypothetical protein